MDQLPEELIASICNHCDHPSLKQIRLVNQQFRRLSTPLVFREFQMGLFNDHLFYLRYLSHSPLARYVEKLTFYCDALPLEWDEETWRAAIDVRPPFEDWYQNVFRARPTSKVIKAIDPDPIRAKIKDRHEALDEYAEFEKHDLSEEELEGGWAEFQGHVRQQRDWQRFRPVIPFMESVARLSNLQEAEVKWANPELEDSFNQWPFWNAMMRQIFVGPDNWLSHDDFVETDYEFTAAQAAIAVLEAIQHRASFAGTKQLTTLKIQSPQLAPYRLVGGHHALSAFSLQRLCSAFTDLTALHFHVPHATLSKGLYGASLAQETMAFLRAAKQLRMLSLHFGEDGIMPYDSAFDESSQLHPLFASDTTVWSHLTTLSLETNVHGPTLIKFLKLHATTLTSLELRNMLVRGVIEALEAIPKTVKLSHVYFESLWEDEEEFEEEVNEFHVPILTMGTDCKDLYSQEIKAYLLGQSETMPVIEPDLEGVSLADPESEPEEGSRFTRP